MHNLRRYYYKNKEKIWKVVLIIASLLAVIYFIDNRVIDESNQQGNDYQLREETIYDDDENQTYISDTSAISGGTISKTEVEKINNTISKFLQYCKEGKVEEAYNMLSTDCKESSFKTVEKFNDNYVKTKFSSDQIYEIQNWISNTYKVSMLKDMMATGEISSTKEVEYITIVKEGSEQKLNIDGYIGKKDINKEDTENNIKITAISKEIYLDYEIYNLKIENLSDKMIKMDSLEKIGTIYIKDSNGNTYNAYTNEIFPDDLVIRRDEQRNISIKYANNYSLNKNIKKIVFENVILDYSKYIRTENTNGFEDIGEVIIDI